MNVWFLEINWQAFIKEFLDIESPGLDFDFSDSYGIFLYWESEILTREELTQFQNDILDKKGLFDDPSYVIPARAPELDISQFANIDKTKDLFESVSNQLATRLPANLLIDLTSLLSKKATAPKPTGYIFNIFQVFENTENYQNMTLRSLIEANKGDPIIKDVVDAFTSV